MVMFILKRAMHGLVGDEMGSLNFLSAAGIIRPSISQVLKQHEALFAKLTAGPAAWLAKWFLRMSDGLPVVFNGINMEESFVRSWGKGNGAFHLSIVASLAKEHPEYTKPPKGQLTCQKDARIEFAGVTQLNGLLPMQTNVDHTDKWPLDYGPISPFLSNRRGNFYLEGEFGQVTTSADAPRLALEPSGWSIVGRARGDE